MSALMTPEPMSDERIAEIRRAWDGVDAASHRLTVTNTRTPGQLFHALSRASKDVPALLAEVERLRTKLATVLKNYEALQGEAITLEGERDEARIEAGQIRAELAEERARHGELVAEMQRARQTADEARAEQVRLAEQVRVLAGLLRRGNPKVFCSKHPNHAEPGCEVCRDAGIFRSALGEQDGDQADG
ncbi:hypothetical protein AB0K34_13515 [Actinomadura sp. NPDC049382]|uniref:hypothetical protein n=1 Tax=Actinomadura sp. NPDC049382 TaxID=3158220 RepID=UPI0034360CCF